MSPEFAKLVDPVFLTVLRVVHRLEVGERVDLERERVKIRNLIDRAERAVTSQSASGIRPEEFALAKYGLVCWVDELMTRVYPNWENDKLEVHYFGSPGKRAWRFYIEGEMHARHSTADVAELWYLAMALGFEGEIGDAFSQLNQPLPGGTSDEASARRAWTRQLRYHESRVPDLAGEPLQCDVPELRGRSLLLTSILMLVLCSAAGGVIYWFWPLGYRDGHVTGTTDGSTPRSQK